MNNKKYFIIILLTFILLVGILFYSYIYKMGYFNIISNTFFVLTPCLILLNVSKKVKSIVSRFFWIMLLGIFLFVLLDKYLRIHIALSAYFEGRGSIPPVILVNILYVIVFIFVISLFYKYIIQEYKQDSDWIKLFIFAIFMKIIAIWADYVFHNNTEDYFELFSLYFFSASFLNCTLSKKNEAKK